MTSTLLLPHRLPYSIAICVIFLHLCFFCWLGFETKAKVVPQKSPQRFVVQTIALQKEQIAIPVPVVEKKAVVIPTTIAVEKKQTAPTKKAEPSSRKSSQSSRAELVRKARAQMGESHTASTVGVVPKKIEQLGIEELSQPEQWYREELVGRLQGAMTLPEQGGVQLKLTLSRSGKVLSVQILKAESQRNSQYIELKLKEIHFPQFGRLFKNQEKVTFSLSLSNL